MPSPPVKVAKDLNITAIFDNGNTVNVGLLPDIDFGAYMAELQTRIKKYWHPPTEDKTKKATVHFSIGHDGKLFDLKIKRSTKTPAADAAALNAVETIADRHVMLCQTFVREGIGLLIMAAAMVVVWYHRWGSVGSFPEFWRYLSR